MHRVIVQVSTPLPAPTLSPQTSHLQNFQRSMIGYLSNSWASCEAVQDIGSVLSNCGVRFDKIQFKVSIWQITGHRGHRLLDVIVWIIRSFGS